MDCTYNICTYAIMPQFVENNMPNSNLVHQIAVLGN